MLTLTIDRNSEQPVYEQVADQLRHLVSSGALSSGTVLPSVRQLASDLGVNLNTVARAYRVLESERFLAIRDRSGVVVAPPAEAVEETTRDKLLEQMRVTLSRLRQAGMATDELLAAVKRLVMAMDAACNRNDMKGA